MQLLAFSHFSIRASHSINSRYDAFQGLQFLGPITSLATALVPAGVSVVAVDDFGTDAPHLAGRPGTLHVAKVGEEGEVSRQPLREGRVGRAIFLKLEHVQYELARGEQPAKGVRKRESDTLTRLVV